MKQSEVAKLMYDLQEYCRYVWDDSDDIGCPKCVANKGGVCDLYIPCYGIPHMWGITLADIERLEKKEIETFTCKDCRHYQCRVSVFSTGKVCERFELWQ